MICLAEFERRLTMKFRFTLIIFLTLSILGVASLVNSQNHPEVTISVLGGPFGTGSYALASATADIAKKYHPWLRVNNVEGAGLIFNIKKLNENPQNKKTMVIVSGRVVTWLAENGMKPFDKKYPPCQLLGNFFLVSTWLATLNPDIRTANDFVGKKVALGRMTQVNWGLEADWLIRYGWGIRDKVTVQFMGPKAAATALMDGLVDAAIAGAYVDPLKMTVKLSPQAVEMMASGRKIYFIPWGEEAVRKVIAKGMPIVPFTIPANTIKGLANGNEPLPVFSDTGCFVVDPEFPEEIAYEFTKLLINNISKFGEYVAVGKLMSLKALTLGWNLGNIHPGAVKAYREAGVLK
jgi:TRAP transporter TAXI family solute receptor